MGAVSSQPPGPGTPRSLPIASGIKTTVMETQRQGHARTIVTECPVEQLRGMDGVVAVGGDGLFHEVINGLLELRCVLCCAVLCAVATVRWPARDCVYICVCLCGLGWGVECVHRMSLHARRKLGV